MNTRKKPIESANLALSRSDHQAFQLMDDALEKLDVDLQTGLLELAGCESQDMIIPTYRWEDPVGFHFGNE